MAIQKTPKKPIKKAITTPRPGNWQQMRGFWHRYRAVITVTLIGFVAGVLWLAGIRFLLVRSPETHYHANFAVYMDGVREEFKEFTYYEEVAACTADYAGNPKGRVHMHGQVNDVIHVHDQRVTYGNFFQNIGWNVGSGYLATLDKLYQTGGDSRVTYILNGETVDNIANRLIGSTDRLLVSYDSVETDFMKQYESVAATAEEVNGRPDPATCSGLGGTSQGLKARLKRATFWD